MNIKELWQKLKDFFSTNGLRVITFFVVLVLGVIAIRLFCKILRKGMSRGKMGKGLAGFLSTVLKYLLYLALIFVLAGIAGIDMSPLTTVLLSAGLAISLALQDSLSNVANGMIIVTTKPFEEGDMVDFGGLYCTVVHIGLISTQFITPDNRKITIPNTKIMGETIVNITAQTTRRVDLAFSVSRDADPATVKKILTDVLTANETTLADQPITVRMVEITDNSFKYIARPWVKTEDYWETLWLLTEKVAAAFKEAGIKIPYQTLDLNMTSENSAPPLNNQRNME